MLLAMVYAPWVNEWFDNIAELVDPYEVGVFFRMSSNTWEVQGVDEVPDVDGDTGMTQFVYYDVEDDADNIDENDQELVEQEHFEFQLWVRGVDAYAELFDPSDEWEVLWNENFAPRREPWLYVEIDDYVGRDTHGRARHGGFMPGSRQ